MSKDLINDMVAVSDYLDSIGMEREASVMDNMIQKVAAKKDGGEGIGDALAGLVDRFEERFTTFATRIEGGTATKTIRAAGGSTRKVAECLIRIETAIGDLKTAIGK